MDKLIFGQILANQIAIMRALCEVPDVKNETKTILLNGAKLTSKAIDIVKGEK